MKKVFLLIISILIINNYCEAKTINYENREPLKCYIMSDTNFNDISNNSSIIRALEFLKNNGYDSIVNSIVKSDTRIIFYDFNLLKLPTKNLDDYNRKMIMKKVSREGNNYVLISKEFINSPAVALASLIAYDTLHVQSVTTTYEEVNATNIEAEIWLKSENKYENKDRLVKKLNEIANTYNPNSTKQMKKWVKSKGFNVICGGM